MKKQVINSLLMVGVITLYLSGCSGSSENKKTESEIVTEAAAMATSEATQGTETEKILQDSETPVTEEIESESSGAEEKSESDDSAYGYEETEGGVSIYSYHGEAAEVVIPSQIDGKDVVKINGAFESNSKVIKVVIPESVTTIEEESFVLCTALESVIFEGNNLKEIPDTLFMGCSNLVEVKLPESLEIIGGASFGNCTSLQEITIPENVTSIGNLAFRGCQNLQRCVIPASVTEMTDTIFDEGIDLTIVTPAGSFTEQYANDKGIKVENE